MADGPTSNPYVTITEKDQTNQIARDTATAVNSNKGDVSIPAPPSFVSDFNAAQYARDLAVIATNMPDVPLKDIRADADLPNVMAAAFRTGNALGALMANGYGTQETGAPMTSQEVMSRARTDGFSPYLSAFKYVATEDQYKSTAAALRQQMDDNRALAASGVSGTAALLMAGIIDLPLVSPLTPLAAAGKAGRLATAARVGGAAAVETAGAEALIGAATPMPHDGFFENVASATLLGNVVGFAIGTRLGRGVEAKVTSRLDEVRTEAAQGFPKTAKAADDVVQQYDAVTQPPRGQPVATAASDGVPRATEPITAASPEPVGSAGAARVDPRTAADIRANAEPLPSMGVNLVLKKLGDIPVFGEYIRLPRRDLETSPFTTARRILDTMMGKMNPNITTADAAGVARGEGVFDLASKFEGLAADAVDKVKDIARVAIRNGEFKNFDEFDRALARELTVVRAGDTVNEMSPATVRAAKIMRDQGFEPVRLQHVENGNFRKHMEPVNAHAYFPLVADGEAIQLKKGEIGTPGTFMDDQYNALVRQLEGEVQHALAIRDVVRNTQDSIKIRIKGDIQRVDAGLTKGGNPKYKYVVNKDGWIQTTNKDIDAVGAIAMNRMIDNEIAVKIDGTRELQRIKADREVAVQTAREKALNVGNESANKQISALESKRLADEASAQQEIAALNQQKIANEIAMQRDIAELTRERNDVIFAVRKNIGTERNTGDARNARAAGVRGEYKGKFAAIKQQALKDKAKLDAEIASIEKRVAVQKSEIEAEQARIQTEAETKIAAQADEVARRVEKQWADKERKLQDQIKKDLLKAAKEKKDLEAKIKELRAEAKAAAELEYKKEIDSHQLPDGLDDTLKLADRKAGVPDPEKIDKRARELAEWYYGQYTGTNRFILPHQVSPGIKGFNRARVQPMAHTLMMDRGYALDKATEIAYMHARISGVEASFGKYFKKKVREYDPDLGRMVDREIGDPNMTEAKRALEEEIKLAIQNAAPDPKMVAKAERAYEKAVKAAKGDAALIEAAAIDRDIALANARAQGERTATADGQRALQSIDTLGNFARGNRAMTGSPKAMRDTLEALGAVNALTKGGGFLLSSMTDPGNIVAANGFGRTVSYGVVPALKQFFIDWHSASPEARHLSRLANANTETVLTAHMAQSADLLNPLSKGTGPMEALRRSTKLFFKFTGLEGWTAIWKQVAYMTTQSRILEHAEQGWDKLSNSSRALLSSLGIDQKELEAIHAQWKAQSMTHENGAPFAQWDQWADKAVAENFRQALHAQTNNNIITPHFSDKLTMERTPWGSSILQFKRFTLTQQSHVMGRNAQLMAADGYRGEKALEVYSGLASLLFLAALVDGMKKVTGESTLTGESKSSNDSAWQKYIQEWEKNPGGALYNVLDRTSIFGFSFMGSQMLENVGLPNIKRLFAYAANDENKTQFSAKASQANIGEVLLGPSVGLAQDVLGATKHAANSIGWRLGIGEEPQYSRGDWRRDRRLIIGGNAPLVQQLLNTGEKYMGTVYDWPDK